jgi:hypothetical protein
MASCSFPHNADTLLSAGELKGLHGKVQLFGAVVVEAAIAERIKQQQDRHVITWEFYTPCIKIQRDALHAVAAQQRLRKLPQNFSASDERLTQLIDADGAHVLVMLKANKEVWTKRLQAFLAEQRAKHGYTDKDILTIVVDELQRLAVAEGAELVARLLSERGHINRWNMFFAAVAEAIGQMRATSNSGAG